MLFSLHHAIGEARIIWGMSGLEVFLLCYRQSETITGDAMNYITGDVINFDSALFLRRHGFSSAVISSSGKGLLL